MPEWFASTIEKLLDFSNILNASIAASWMVLAVIILRYLLKKAPRWTHVALWGVVAVRMLLPFSIESAFSLIPSKETIPHEILVYEGTQLKESAFLDVVSNPVFSGSVTVELGETVDRMQISLLKMNLIWIMGIAVLLLYTVVSYWRLRRKVSEATVLRNNIYQSENVPSPFVLGIIKPKIYLPYDMNEQDLGHVVAHEQAHIRRRDHWWKPLGFLLLTIHWFNPLMWLAYILLCRDIELACDEKVIKELGSEQRADYTQALVVCSVKRRTIAACPLAFGEVGVKERVKSVMNYKKPAFWIIVLSVVACVVVAVCFLTDPSAPEKEPNYLKISSLYIGTEQEIVNLTARLELVELLQTYEKKSFHVGLDDPNDTSIPVHISFSDGSSCLLHYYFYDGLSWEKLTSGEGYYRCVLTYWDADGTVSAWEFIENFNYKFMAWYNKWKSPEPVLTQTSFSNIMGCSGYVITDNTMEFWSNRDYVAIIENQQFVIAQAFGFGDPQDYVRDLDGDGISELIANVQFNGDGAEMAYVYQRRGNTIYQGTFSPSDLPDHNDWGANSTYSEYDPKTGVFYFYYAQVGSEEYAVLTTTSLSDFDFVAYCVLPGENSGNTIINIVDPTKDEEFCYDDAVEKFYADENNEYFFSGIYSQYVIVHYADGTTENIVTALSSGRATLADLNRFGIRYWAEPKPQDLSSAISTAILEHYASDAPGGLIHVESHVLLANEAMSGTPLFGANDHAEKVTAYLLVYQVKYSTYGGTLEAVSGSYVPTAITFKVSESGEYVLEEYWEPRDGIYYADDIRKKFPGASADDALNDQGYIEKLKAESYNKALAYLNSIGSLDAIIEKLLGEIQSSPAHSSNPGDYIREHETEYTELLGYGEYTLRYCFTEFLQGSQYDLRGHIMRALLDDLAPEAQLRLYAMTGQEYFDAWKAAAIRVSEQHDMEWIWENQPAIWILLEMIGE